MEITLDRRTTPDETFGDEDIQVESIVRNKTRTNLSNVEVSASIDDRITLKEGVNMVTASIPPGGEARLTAEFRSPARGNYEIGPMMARVRDPFGFYLVEKKLSAGNLCVMPRPERLRGVQLRTKHVGPWPGIIPSKVLGIGTEFYSTREYVHGDDPKRINWKASAKRNSLIVNENEAERVTDVMVVLDSDVTFYGPVQGELFERGVQAAASITSLLLKQGNRVGLVLQGIERGSIKAGFGKRHERRILYLLAAARPGRAKVSTSYIISLLARRMLPSSAQIVIISSLLDPDMKEGVTQLITAGYNLLILSPAPTAPSSFVDPTEEIAFKIIMLERSITLLALERTSTVIDWPHMIPLSSIMSKVGRTRPIITAQNF